jgi:hypothetical protein
MKIKNTEPFAADKSRVKKFYKSPSMICYGAVRELTLSGSGQASENASTPFGCADTFSKPNPACDK